MAELTSAIDQTHQGVRDMIAGMAARFSGSIDPQASALKAVYGLLQKQATTLAFGDAFALLAIGCACAGFLTLLSKPAKPNAAAASSDVH